MFDSAYILAYIDALSKPVAEINLESRGRYKQNPQNRELIIHIMITISDIFISLNKHTHYILARTG